MSPIPENVVDKELYAKIKQEIHRDLKEKNTRWGIYASSRLVKTYKKQGGTYTNDKNQKTTVKKKNTSGPIGLDRWFKEIWINICESQPPQKIVKCGRSKIEKEKNNNTYPVCRPYKRITPETPKTYQEMDKTEIDKICKQKRRVPLKVLPKFK
jgi:hypothetical protein